MERISFRNLDPMKMGGLRAAINDMAVPIETRPYLDMTDFIPETLRPTAKAVAPKVTEKNGVKTLDMSGLDAQARMAEQPKRKILVPTEAWKAFFNPKSFPEKRADGTTVETGMRYVAIKTDNYTLTPHAVPLNIFADALQEEGVEEFLGRVVETPTRAWVQVLMTDEAHTITPKDGKKIFTGFVAGNAYGAVDGPQSIYYRGIGGRGYCANIFNAAELGEIIVAHVGDLERIKEKLRNFIRENRKAQDEYLHKLDKAIDTPVTDPLVAYLARACGFQVGKSLAMSTIYHTMAEDDKGNLYSVYNAITQHARDQSIATQEDEIKKADYLLDEPKEALRLANELMIIDQGDQVAVSG